MTMPSPPPSRKRVAIHNCRAGTRATGAMPTRRTPAPTGGGGLGGGLWRRGEFSAPRLWHDPIRPEEEAMPERNRQVLLKRRPEGMPVPSDFDIVDAPLPEPKEGEVLL